VNTANGFICLYRQITQWEWYQNPNTFRLFVHCLLMANFTDGRFEGKEVKRGQFVTSLPSLAKQTSLSIQQVRTALAHLISTGELTDNSTPHYRIITVVKYNEYQQDNRQNNRQSTDNQQTSNRQSTGNQQQYKKNNNLDVVDSTNNILSLSSEEIAESIQRDHDIEDAALNAGLMMSPSAMMKARDLADRYGMNQLLAAINAAVDVPKWSYVEGILRNNKNDERESEREAEEYRKDHQEMMKQVLINRGEWDEEYQCSRDKAKAYREKGFSPEEAADDMERERKRREKIFNDFSRKQAANGRRVSTG